VGVTVPIAGYFLTLLIKITTNHGGRTSKKFAETAYAPHLTRKGSVGYKPDKNAAS